MNLEPTPYFGTIRTRDNRVSLVDAYGRIRKTFDTPEDAYTFLAEYDYHVRRLREIIKSLDYLDA